MLAESDGSGGESLGLPQREAGGLQQPPGLQYDRGRKIQRVVEPHLTSDPACGAGENEERMLTWQRSLKQGAELFSGPSFQ